MQNETSLFADISLVRWLRFEIIPLYKALVCFLAFFYFQG